MSRSISCIVDLDLQYKLRQIGVAQLLRCALSAALSAIMMLCGSLGLGGWGNWAKHFEHGLDYNAAIGVKGTTRHSPFVQGPRVTV